MKTFLAIYTGSPDSREADAWNRLDAAGRQVRQRQGMQAWERWVALHRNAIVDTGAPLGKTLRVSREGIEASRNAMAAFVIVRDESHEAAANMFEGHPHFTIFPGDAVEIMECLPLPTAD